MVVRQLIFVCVCVLCGRSSAGAFCLALPEARFVRVVSAAFIPGSSSLFNTSGLLRDSFASVVFSAVSFWCRWLPSYNGGAAVPFVVHVDSC